MTDKAREAFEDWHDNIFDVSARSAPKDCHGYTDHILINARWNGWKSCLAYIENTRAAHAVDVEKAVNYLAMAAPPSNESMNAVRTVRAALSVLPAEAAKGEVWSDAIEAAARLCNGLASDEVNGRGESTGRGIVLDQTAKAIRALKKEA